MPLDPKHLLFPSVFQPHSPPPPNKGHRPRLDTSGVGHKNLCAKQGVKWPIPL